MNTRGECLEIYVGIFRSKTTNQPLGNQMNISSRVRIAAIASAIVLALTANTTGRAQQAPAPTDATNVSPTPKEPSDSDVSASNDAPVILSQFEVGADSNVGYGAASTSSASRIAQNYIDVPQTVNVVTSQLIKDFNFIDQREILQYVPNVAATQGGTVYVRGAPVSSNYIDGVDTASVGNGNPIFFFDRLEIVKGPSSAAFGQGEPGGLINYISKVPSGSTDSYFDVGIGDHENYLFDFDTQGRLAQNKKISYRLVGFWDHGYGPVKTVSQHGGAGAQLSLRYDFNDTTLIQAVVRYSNVGNAGPDQAFWFNNEIGLQFLHQLGLPLPPHPVSKDADLTPGGWGDETFLETTQVDVSVEKSLLDKHVNIRENIMLENVPDHYTYTTIDNIYGPSPGKPSYYTGVDRGSGFGTNNAFNENLDIAATYKFPWVKSTTLLGGDFHKGSSDGQNGAAPDVDANGNFYTIDIYNPNLTPLPVLSSPVTDSNGNVHQPYYLQNNNASKNEFYGYYAQEDLSVFDDRLTASAGFRSDYSWNKFTNFIPTPSTTSWSQLQETKLAPRYAVTIKPLPWLSVYGLYAQHKDPISNVQEYSLSVRGDIQPDTLAQYGNFQKYIGVLPGGVDHEVGVKATFFDGNLTFSGAVFHEIVSGAVQQSTVIIPDPDGSVTQVVITTPVSNDIKGCEVEVAGRLWKRLWIVADYGITRGIAGNSTPEAPQWVTPPVTVSGHLRYDLGDLRGNGLYVTFGGIYYGEFWMNQNPYTYYNQTQYAIDGGIGYAWDKGRQKLYLNVDNITDQLNDVGFQGNGYVSPQREAAYLTYTYHFR